MDGIEVSGQSVEEAQKRQLPFSHFQRYDGERLPFGDGLFDVVAFCVVMHHVPPKSQEALLRECRRVLKPSGALYVFEHNPLNPLTQYIVKRCPFDKDAILLRSGEAVGLLRRTGFEVVTRRFINFFPNWFFPRKLMTMEKWFGCLPLGAQYYIRAERRG
ncbi:MAG: methyltransferase domain-containing protein [Verrucomicrobiota bacterium]|jgi:SAM-dependent methyltransferase|nr:methyltransferase domain-containing protein [Verrucomicrobiota bacterium]